MFTHPSALSPWWIESDQGFSIKQTNRFEMTYKDAEKSVSFEIEAGEESITIFSKTIKIAIIAGETRELTQPEKVDILNKVQSALKSTGKLFEVV
jgi:hypothetical protein